MSIQNEKYEKALAKIKAAAEKRHALAKLLLANIKSELDTIDKLAFSFEKAETEFIYRFYHQSFKVFGYKELIRYTIPILEKLAPESQPLNAWYREIVEHGLAQEFSDSTNKNWLSETQLLLNAFWHTSYFVRHIRSASELEEAPEILPYDWAAVLYLYDLR